MRQSLRPLLVFAYLLIAGVATAHAAAARLMEPEPHGKSTRLAVLLHSFTADGASMRQVTNVLLETDGWADTDTLAPDLPFGRFSITSPAEVLANLVVSIDAAWTKRLARGQPYEQIVIIGHSMGSLFARKLYAVACGEIADAPFESELKERLAAIGAAPVDAVRPWAGTVKRIVLMAGLNRGWSISHHMSLWRGLTMSAGVSLSRWVEALTGEQFIIMAAHRGAPFITQLRLQWLAMRARAKAAGANGVGGAPVVQLLGTTDDLVPPSDNVDAVTGSDFNYIEVPQSSHENVVEMDSTNDSGRLRASALRDALTSDGRNPRTIRPLSIQRQEEHQNDSKVTDVVFVVHGIRDEGYWTEKIAQRILAQARAQGRENAVAVEISSYGYFPMLSFLRAGARQEKVEWLMDRYTTAKARYPKAKFSFIGHSNGTYLLAKALEDYPAVRFHNVVFAGSVVRHDYKWDRYPVKRVHSVFNFVADADWVVAYFPNALQQMHIQDLGSAGHDGFADSKRAIWLPKPGQYVAGGHAAALGEVWWDAIASLVNSGEFQQPAGANVSENHAWYVKYPGKAAPLVWFVIALILAAGLYGLLKLRLREWKKTLVLVAYFGFIWTILTEY